MTSFFSSGLFNGILNMDPLLRAAQLSLLVVGGILVFLVFSATRDILQRTHSLPYQIGCILLVAALPFVGYLLYLLVRPSQTTRAREMEKNVEEILALLTERSEKIQHVKTKAQAAVAKSSKKKDEANERISSKIPAAITK